MPKVKIAVERETGPFHSRLLSLVLPSNHRVTTPCFIASLSSTAAPHWVDLAKGLKSGIAAQGLVLVSAKDIEETRMRRLDGFAGVVLDSGGYESRRQRKSWSPRRYTDVCKRFRADIVVGFDADELTAPPVRQQIARQVRAFRSIPAAALRVLLLHARSHELESRDVADALQATANDWDVLGVVEKDLGLTLTERVHGVRRARDLLDTTALYRPVHVFGAGDPFAIAMYALAGADLFDALSWYTGFIDAEALVLLPFEAHEFSERWRAFADERGGPRTDAVRRGLVAEWNLGELARLCMALQKAVLDRAEPRDLDFLKSRRADYGRMAAILEASDVAAVLSSLRSGP